MPQCAAWGCHNKSGVNKGKTFHRFPINQERRLVWINAMKRESFQPGNNTRLCGDHFEQGCFVRTEGLRRLKVDAVPSIFVWPNDVKMCNRSRKRLVAEESAGDSQSQKDAASVNHDASATTGQAGTAAQGTEADPCETDQDNTDLNDAETDDEWTKDQHAGTDEGTEADCKKTAGKKTKADRPKTSKKDIKANCPKTSKKDIEANCTNTVGKRTESDHTKSNEKGTETDHPKPTRKRTTPNSTETVGKETDTYLTKTPGKRTKLNTTELGRKETDTNVTKTAGKMTTLHSTELARKQTDGNHIKGKNSTTDHTKVALVDRTKPGKYTSVDNTKPDRTQTVEKETEPNHTKTVAKTTNANLTKMARKSTPADRTKPGKYTLVDNTKPDRTQTVEKETEPNHTKTVAKTTNANVTKTARKSTPADRTKPGKKSPTMNSTQTGKNVTVVGQGSRGQESRGQGSRGQETGSPLVHSPAYLHWKRLGAQRGLREDRDIACFLLHYYEHTSRVLPAGLTGVCKTCGTPLSVSCTRCDWIIIADATCPSPHHETSLNESTEEGREGDGRGGDRIPPNLSVPLPPPSCQGFPAGVKQEQGWGASPPGVCLRDVPPGVSLPGPQPSYHSHHTDPVGASSGRRADDDDEDDGCGGGDEFDDDDDEDSCDSVVNFDDGDDEEMPSVVLDIAEDPENDRGLKTEEQPESFSGRGAEDLDEQEGGEMEVTEGEEGEEDGGQEVGREEEGVASRKELGKEESDVLAVEDSALDDSQSSQVCFLVHANDGTGAALSMEDTDDDPNISDDPNIHDHPNRNNALLINENLTDLPDQTTESTITVDDENTTVLLVNDLGGDSEASQVCFVMNDRTEEASLPLDNDVYSAAQDLVVQWSGSSASQDGDVDVVRTGGGDRVSGGGGETSLDDAELCQFDAEATGAGVFTVQTDLPGQVCEESGTSSVPGDRQAVHRYGGNPGEDRAEEPFSPVEDNAEELSLPVEDIVKNPFSPVKDNESSPVDSQAVAQGSSQSPVSEGEAETSATDSTGLPPSCRSEGEGGGGGPRLDEWELTRRCFLDHSYILQTSAVTQVPNQSQSSTATKTAKVSVEKCHKCPDCGKAFCWFTEVLRHMQTHSREKPFVCELCGDSFLTGSRMKNHQRKVHKVDAGYECERCGETFLTVHFLQKHRIVHRDQIQSERHQTLGIEKCVKKHRLPASGEKLFKCDEYYKSLSSSSRLHRHQKMHRKKQFMCDECGRIFKHLGSLRYHKRIHSMGLLMCDECGKIFPNLQSLSYHKRSHSMGSIVCDKCGRTFPGLPSLILHKRIHAPLCVTNAVRHSLKNLTSPDTRQIAIALKDAPP